MPAAMLLAAVLCQAPAVSVTVSVEPRTESIRYRFDNPSNFNTIELVPHSFEQTYDTDHVWLRAAVRYPLFRTTVRVDAGATPAATRRADDFDTFHQPDGNVITSGTTGNATLRAWNVAGRVTMGRVKRVEIGLAYEYRRDRWRFHDGDGVVTTTMPATVTHRVVTTRETTVSQIHAVNWVAEGEKKAGPRGTVAVTLTAAPVALARLTVELPDKYPGQLLAYHAKVAAVDVAAWYRRAFGGWVLAAGARAGRSFSWSRSAQMHLAGASLLVEIGRR